jgi:hypothetical protein
MKRARGPWRLLALAPLLAWLLACAQGAAGDEQSGVPTNVESCSADAQCGGGLVCDRAARVCTGEGALPYALSFDVRPAAGSGLAPTQFADLEVGAEHALPPLMLGAPLNVEGAITVEGFQAANVVPSALIATAVADIDGWDDYQVQGAIELDPASSVYRYSLRLLPNRTWRLTLFFEDEVFPPTVVERLFTQKDTQFDLQVAPLSSYPEITGYLLYRDGAPVAGVQLVALTRETGTVYSSSITAADGHFDKLRLPPDLKKVQLMARPTEQFPTFPQQDLEGWYDVEAMQNADSVSIMIPSLPPSHRYRFALQDAAQAPLDGVELHLDGQVNGGRVALVYTSDSRGLVEADLYAGTFTWTAVPQAFADDGLSRGVLELPEGDTEVPLALAAKLASHLEVLGEAGGAGVGGADVYLALTRVGGAALDIDRVYHLVTDSRGGLDALLEEGRYQVLVVPAAYSGLPRWAVTDVDLPGNAGATQVVLPRPWLLHGTLRGPDEAPLAGATLKVIRPLPQVTGREPDAGVTLTPNQATLQRLVAETVTDSNGTWRVFLPYSL